MRSPRSWRLLLLSWSTLLLVAGGDFHSHNSDLNEEQRQREKEATRGFYIPPQGTDNYHLNFVKAPPKTQEDWDNLRAFYTPAKWRPKGGNVPWKNMAGQEPPPEMIVHLNYAQDDNHKAFTAWMQAYSCVQGGGGPCPSPQGQDDGSFETMQGSVPDTRTNMLQYEKDHYAWLFQKARYDSQIKGGSSEIDKWAVRNGVDWPYYRGATTEATRDSLKYEMDHSWDYFNYFRGTANEDVRDGLKGQMDMYMGSYMPLLGSNPGQQSSSQPLEADEVDSGDSNSQFQGSSIWSFPSHVTFLRSGRKLQEAKDLNVKSMHGDQGLIKPVAPGEGQNMPLPVPAFNNQQPFQGELHVPKAHYHGQTRYPSQTYPQVVYLDHPPPPPPPPQHPLLGKHTGNQDDGLHQPPANYERCESGWCGPVGHRDHDSYRKLQVKPLPSEHGGGINPWPSRSTPSPVQAAPPMPDAVYHEAPPLRQHLHGQVEFTEIPQTPLPEKQAGTTTFVPIERIRESPQGHGQTFYTEVPTQEVPDVRAPVVEETGITVFIPVERIQATTPLPPQGQTFYAETEPDPDPADPRRPEDTSGHTIMTPIQRIHDPPKDTSPPIIVPFEDRYTRPIQKTRGLRGRQQE